MSIAVSHIPSVPKTLASAACDLPAPAVTAEAFAPFGKLIEPTPDGAPTPEIDRALELAGGRPRFYVMALANRGRSFSRITRHRAATQVLASANGGSWLLAVAPPGEAAAPEPAAIRGFTIPGGVGLLLSCGTWHAGPFFEGDSMNFFNLELDDTNAVDHDSADLAASFGVTFILSPSP